VSDCLTVSSSGQGGEPSWRPSRSGGAAVSVPIALGV
jgi:hypothetical protein